MDEYVCFAYTVMRTIAIDTGMKGPCCSEHMKITIDIVSRKRGATGVTKTVTITPAVADGRWKMYDNNFKQIETGEGTKSVNAFGGKYYYLFHNAANVNRG